MLLWCVQLNEAVLIKTAGFNILHILQMDIVHFARYHAVYMILRCLQIDIAQFTGYCVHCVVYKCGILGCVSHLTTSPGE